MIILCIVVISTLVNARTQDVEINIPTFGFNSNWSSVETQSEFLHAISTSGLLYWAMPESHELIYNEAYENGLQFFQMTNKEWPNGGEFLPSSIGIYLLCCFFLYFLDGCYLASGTAHLGSKSFCVLTYTCHDRIDGYCIETSNNCSCSHWNMSFWQTSRETNDKNMDLFFYGYNDYRNSIPPSYIKHFVLPMHNKNIIYNNDYNDNSKYSYNHPFNHSVLLYCKELIEIAEFVLHKIFTIANITFDVDVIDAILGDNHAKHCAVGYYHFPGMYTNMDNYKTSAATNESQYPRDGFSPHKDLGFLTILKQDSGGLDILYNFSNPQNSSNCVDPNGSVDYSGDDKSVHVGYGKHFSQENKMNSMEKQQQNGGTINNTNINNGDEQDGSNININGSVMDSEELKCEWVAVKFDKNKYVINLSALLEHLTNSQIKAPIHRVGEVNHERMTFALFFDPDYQNGFVFKFNKENNTLIKETSIKQFLKESAKQIFDIDAEV